MREKMIFLIILFSVVVIFNSAIFAEEAIKIETAPAETEAIKTEAAPSEIEPETHVYHFPDIKPELYGLLGYRFVNLTGSEKAGEYEYLHNSVVAGGEIRLFLFPHRIHLDADMLNKKDYFIDMSYAYSDLILFRGIDRALFHNLDNITLTDPYPASTSGDVLVKDAGERYGSFSDFKNVFLRLKTHDFPFHVYFDGKFYNKDSSQQHRLYGSPTSTDTYRVRISQKRDVDLEVKDYTVGMNTHLGPVEADLSHGEKRLEVTGDKILSNYYNTTTSTRFYPYGLLPDLKSSTNTLKLHTSYTGRLVVSTTLSDTDKKNQDSGARADYLTGSVEVTYIPYHILSFVARYRHKEIDMENPSALPAGYLGYSGFTTVTTVKPSLSSQTDTLSGFARFRPFKGLGLNAEYTYERIKRKHSEEWELAEKTTQRNMALSTNIRPLKKLTFKLRYAHRDINNPAYNVQPNTSNEGSISMSWSPLTWANTLLSYSIAKEKRDNLHFEDTDAGSIDAENRKTKRDKLLGSITFVLFGKLSVTPSYAYFHNKIKQDLIYNNAANTADQLDTDVAYKDTARSYAINLNYAPTNNFNINADASQTKGKGSFYPGNSAALQTTSIAYFSELKVKETGYSIGSDYRFKGEWAVGIKYRYNSFRDLIDNIYDDAQNGIVRIVMVTISKKW